MSTNHNNIIGEVQSGGFSSTLTPLEHLKEETRIRLKNKQNILLIVLIFVNTLIKILLKKLFKKHKSICKVLPFFLFENPLSTDHNLNP